MSVPTKTVTSEAVTTKTDQALRILLIGWTGDGKSSTGNSILGEHVFSVSCGERSVTEKCERKTGLRFGHSLEVVDTPGIYDTSQQNVHKEFLRAFSLTGSDYDAIIYVLKLSRLLNTTLTTEGLLLEWFGENVKTHGIILITHAVDQDMIIKLLVNNVYRKVKKTIQDCCNRIVLFNNEATEMENDEQVQRLLSIIDYLNDQNQGQRFRNKLIDLAKLYALTKYPEKLSRDSVHILDTIGLSREILAEKYTFLFDHSLNEETSANCTTVWAQTVCDQCFFPDSDQLTDVLPEENIATFTDYESMQLAYETANAASENVLTSNEVTTRGNNILTSNTDKTPQIRKVKRIISPYQRFGFTMNLPCVVL